MRINLGLSEDLTRIFTIITTVRFIEIFTCDNRIEAPRPEQIDKPVNNETRRENLISSPATLRASIYLRLIENVEARRMPRLRGRSGKTMLTGVHRMLAVGGQQKMMEHYYSLYRHDSSRYIGYCKFSISSFANCSDFLFDIPARRCL